MRPCSPAADRLTRSPCPEVETCSKSKSSEGAEEHAWRWRPHQNGSCDQTCSLILMNTSWANASRHEEGSTTATIEVNHQSHAWNLGFHQNTGNHAVQPWRRFLVWKFAEDWDQTMRRSSDLRNERWMESWPNIQRSRNKKHIFPDATTQWRRTQCPSNPLSQRRYLRSHWTATGAAAGAPTALCKQLMTEFSHQWETCRSSKSKDGHPVFLRSCSFYTQPWKGIRSSNNSSYICHAWRALFRIICHFSSL